MTCRYHPTINLAGPVAMLRREFTMELHVISHANYFVFEDSATAMQQVDAN